MLDYFFSLEHAGDLFEGLSIWEDEKCRALQGSYPVLSLSFARIKEAVYDAARDKVCEILRDLYVKYRFIRESDALADADRDFFTVS